MKNKNNNLKTKLKSFFNKKNVLILTISTSIVSVPVILSIGNLTNNGPISTNLKNYVDSNTKIRKESGTWSITVNGETKTFDDAVKLRMYIDQNFISESTHLSSTDLNNYANDLGQIDGIINSPLMNDIFTRDEMKNISKQVFLGSDDKAYQELDKALKSFYEIKDGYNFNGIYFENKIDLRNYITNVYLQSSNIPSFNSIILKGPNGEISTPININEEGAITKIESFIDSNLKKELVYINDQNNSIKVNSTSNSQINTTDMEYIHVQSNQGESRYVVDVDKDDSGNLIGPYFYEGILDTNSFMDKSMWTRLRNVTKSVYYESQLDNQIGQFFTNILADSGEIIAKDALFEGKVPNLFRTPLQMDVENRSTGEVTTVALDDLYMKSLLEENPRIYKEVVEFNTNILRSKRYNTFFKIPLLYSFILQRIVSYNGSQKLLNNTISYFTNVCNIIQEKIESILGPNKDQLLKRDLDNKVFNTREFFQIGNPEYDINTSTEYFLNEFKTWNKLVAAITTYNWAVTNINLFGGLATFDTFQSRQLIEQKVIDEVTYRKHEKDFERIFYVFSSLNWEQMLDSLKKYDPSGAQIDTKTKYELLLSTAFSRYNQFPEDYVLKSIASENTIEHERNLGLIANELTILNESGYIIEGGFLIDLYSPDPKIDRLSKYLEIMNKNPTLDAYQVYMGFMIESRTPGYTSPIDNIKNPSWTDVFNVVVRIMGTSIGATPLIIHTAKNIYGGTKDLALKKRNKRNSVPKKNSSNHSINRTSRFRKARNGRRSRGSLTDLELEVNGLINAPDSIKNEIVVENLPNQANNQHPVLYAGKDANNNMTPTASLKTIKPTIHNGVRVLKQESIDQVTRNGDKANIDWNNEKKLFWDKHKFTHLTLWEFQPPDEYWFRYPESDPSRWSPEEKLWRQSNKWDKLHLEYFSKQTLGSSQNGLIMPASDAWFGLAGIDNWQSRVNMTGYYDGYVHENFLDGNQKKGVEWGFDAHAAKYFMIDHAAGVIIWENGQAAYFENNADLKIKDSLRKKYGKSPFLEFINLEVNGSKRFQPLRDYANQYRKDIKEFQGTREFRRRKSDASIYADIVIDKGLSLDNDGKVKLNPTTGKNTPVYGKDDIKGANSNFGEEERFKTNKKSKMNMFAKQAFKRPKMPTSSSQSAKPLIESSSRGAIIKESVRKSVSNVSNIFGKLGYAFVAVEVISILVDLFKTNREIEYYSYKNRDGTEFIWDGGESISQYLGLKTTTISDITTMKLLKPIQITLPQIQEYYFYSDLKYYDPELMKTRIIDDMINNPNAVIGYSFNESWSFSNNEFIKGSETKEEAIKVVYNDLGITFNKDTNEYDFTNINKSSKYLTSVNYSFTDGLVAADESSKKKIVDSIIDNIRTTKIAQMPNMINGYAVESTTRNFVYPGKYWDRSTQQVVENKARNNYSYLIDNSANTLKGRSSSSILWSADDFVTPNVVDSEKKAHQRIENALKQKISIKSKYVLNDEILKTDKFSKMNDDIDIRKVYTVKIPNVGFIHFADKEKATNYVYKALGYSSQGKYKYVFDGKVFNTKQEAYSYANKNKNKFDI